MRIACEKCKAVYLIAEKIIGNKGRMVKCAKCSHCWLVKPTTPTDKPLKLSKCSTSCNNYLKFIIALLIIINIASTFLFYSEYFTKYKIFKNIYEKFSIYDNKNIILENFRLRKEGNNLIITGILTNTTNEDKVFPHIRYTILDEKKKILMRLTVPSSENIIHANEALPISSKVSNIKNNAAYLQIDIGNKLDLLLR